MKINLNAYLTNHIICEDLSMLALYETFKIVLPTWVDESSSEVTEQRYKQIIRSFEFVRDRRIAAIKNVPNMSELVQKTMIREINSVYHHIDDELRSTVASHFDANCFVRDSPFASNSNELVNW
ncbi:hypothetical protein [Vibrio alginolyticus]|uniref:hypothetical protein n=1 Tax=Vibrio alginolyticus TaxID=663 RepID=UPI001BD2BB1E|nr:hypothetical protein [Vibrio alginolyticus]MBS9935814.1 hypothetical protein [Vibrio alginolyticus]